MAWSLFKQKFRESMGKVQVTSIPAEIKCQMEYIESSKEHITAIDNTVEKMIYPWNKSGFNNSEGIADATGAMGRKIEKLKAGRTLVACSESHKYIGMLERKAHEDVRSFASFIVHLISLILDPQVRPQGILPSLDQRRLQSI
jgi:hypothetical protein